MQLSPQTIRAMCLVGAPALPLISPFEHRHVHEQTGMSGGLSCAGYDVHLGSTLLRAEGFKRKPVQPFAHRGLDTWMVPPHTGVLGSTLERFAIPDFLCMHYINKSTMARRFINSCATLAEPGWEGHLTLEIYNQTDYEITLFPGQPIGQVYFQMLDQPTDAPYRGKYQNQDAAPVPALREAK